MSSEWRAYTLEQIALGGKAGMVDGPFGSNLPERLYTPAGVPVIRGSNLTKGKERFRDHEFVYVSEETAESLSRSLCVPGDIVFTKKGTLGQIGFVPSGKSPRYLISSNQMRMRVDPGIADSEFVYYYLAQPKSIEKVIRDSEHTGVPKINLAYLRGFPVAIPSLQKQQTIVAILRALDDRITLLRETNATLEAIAQALFKSWFVDFDPVRAKQEGRAPEGMDEATAALFPGGFEESELGLVPRGWRVGKVEELMELAYGKALKATDRIAGGIPVYGSGGITGFHNVPLVTEPSLIVGRKGTVGSLYWEDRPFFPIDTVFYVRTGKPLTFCFYLLKTLGLEGMNTDGAVPGLNRNNVYRLKVVVPSDEVLGCFGEMVSALRARIFANAQQAQTLATLRDTLLPRLISGQLRLPDAEKISDEVTA